jgi:hypothetical protein
MNDSRPTLKRNGYSYCPGRSVNAAPLLCPRISAEGKTCSTSYSSCGPKLVLSMPSLESSAIYLVYFKLHLFRVLRCWHNRSIDRSTFPNRESSPTLALKLDDYASYRLIASDAQEHSTAYEVEVRVEVCRVVELDANGHGRCIV